jgi:hypothetical protein
VQLDRGQRPDTLNSQHYSLCFELIAGERTNQDCELGDDGTSPTSVKQCHFCMRRETRRRPLVNTMGSPVFKQLYFKISQLAQAFSVRQRRSVGRLFRSVVQH